MSHRTSAILCNPSSALVLEGSVQEPEALASAIVQIERELGPLEVAINNAGINNNAPSEEMSLPQWQKLYDVNVTSVFLSCQAEAKVMLKRGRGSIINIASMSGSIVNRGLNQAHYNSSKAAVIHMSKSFAMEWAGRGVRINVISPGYTLTPMNKRPEVAGVLKELAESTPTKRIAEPEEMARPAVFLASDSASFITGHDLLVDGDFVCW
jgi:NAD(P)-dependent dehydrogenase (short-subunit alcohol dehydrogenase family)